ncbi:MAG: citrate lyase ACP [Exilispira sp.]
MEFIKSEAGSLESSDCFINIEPSEKFIIEITSTVDKQFHDSILLDIEKIVERFKSSYNIDNLPIKIKVDDRGALPFALRARALTALNRSLKR